MVERDLSNQRMIDLRPREVKRFASSREDREYGAETKVEIS